MKNVADIYALSPMQELMLLHALTAEKDDDVLFNQIVYRLDGALDEATYQRVWQHVIDRHPALRTLFIWQESKDPVQVVRQQVSLPWNSHDWRDLPPGDQQDKLDDLLTTDRATSFDLMRPPLMRLTFIHLAADAAWLVWSSHHLITDRWSSALILDEVNTAYEAFVAGAAPTLTPAPRYRDYIGWLAQQDEANARTFWQQSLHDLRARPLPPPTPYDSNTASGADTIRHTFAPAETAILRQFAFNQDSTLGALIPAAWAVVLSAATGRDDVIFGLTVSGRPADLPDATRTVGSFINNVPLRLRLPNTRTLGAWLRVVQDQQLTLQEFEHNSPAQIKEWTGVRPYDALFDTLVVVQNAANLSGPDGVTMTFAHGRLQTAYPISVEAAPNNEELTLTLTYDRTKVTAVLAQKLAAALHSTLLAMPAQAAEPPAALRQATHIEAAQFITAGNAVSATKAATAAPPAEMEPTSTLETRLLALWRNVLGRNGFGVDDNFFNLGGTSLQAMQLATEIERNFGTRLPLTAFLHNATITHLAGEIGQHVDARAWPLVVDIQPQGSRPPFFCVHGLTGDVLWFRELGQCLTPDQPFYGLQAQGLDGAQPGVDDIAEMATLYIDAMRTRQPSGPYFLGGASFGGTVALEMAQQLRNQGETVALLALFDHVPITPEAAAAMPGGPAHLPRLALSWLRNAPRWFNSTRALGARRVWLRVRRKGRTALKTLAEKVTGPRSGEIATADVIDYADMLPAHRQRLIEAHSQAIGTHQPRPYSGRIILFKAQARPLFHQLDDEQAWHSLGSRDKHIITVPGSHEGMFMQPNVNTLASALRQQLAQTQP